MYAVVKAGGKQHKVAVGDVVEVNRLDGDAGDSISLPALLVVDGSDVTTDGSALAKITVTGEIVGHHKGPKIKILKYKNKTGYRKRIGHRQHLTELLVTDIDDGKPKKKTAKAAAKSDTKSDADTATTTTEKSSATKKAAPAESTAAKSTPARPETTTSEAVESKTSDTKPSASKAAAASKATAPKTSKATKSVASKSAKSTDEKED